MSESTFAIPKKYIVKELSKNLRSQLVDSNLKPKMIKLGQALLGTLNHWKYLEFNHTQKKQAHDLLNELGSTPFKNRDFIKLCEILYPNISLHSLQAAWERFPERMYQKSWGRRSFRAPNNLSILAWRRVEFLHELTQLPYGEQHRRDELKQYSLPLEKQLEYDWISPHIEAYAYIWAEEINSGNKTVFQLCEDIIFNKHATGKVSRNLIIALLSSHRSEAWELVEKLLLAAQRQEGLRQTVLESLDHCSLGALKHFVKVIEEQNLIRFSSIVRALGTWTGLGWESAKTSTLKKCIRLAQQFLGDDNEIQKGLKDKDNLTVYMALWAKSVVDVETTQDDLKHLLENGSIEKQCLALWFTGQVKIANFEFPLYQIALQSTNLQVLAFTMCSLPYRINSDSDKLSESDNLSFFARLDELSQSVQEKEKKFTGKVFNWLEFKYERDSFYRSMIGLLRDEQDLRINTLLDKFEDLNLAIREQLARQILGNHGYYTHQVEKERPVSANEKAFALRILPDRGEMVYSIALKTLEKTELNTDELRNITELLTRKSKTLRSGLLKLVLKQENEIIKDAIDLLIEAKNLEQRLAALELISEVDEKDEWQDDCSKWVTSYSARTRINKREQEYLDKIAAAKSNEALSPENGYGIYTPKQRKTYPLPKRNMQSTYEKRIKKNQYGFSCSHSHLKEEINKLNKLFEENKEYEYEVCYYGNSKDSVILNNTYHSKLSHQQREKLSDREIYESYPLWEVWEEWFKKSKLDALDLKLLTWQRECQTVKFKEFVTRFIYYSIDDIPNNKNNNHWNNPIIQILSSLNYAYPYPRFEEFCSGLAKHMYSEFDDNIIQFEHKREVENYRYYGNRLEESTGWQRIHDFNHALNFNSVGQLSLQAFEELLALYLWRQHTGLTENINRSVPPIELCARGVSEGLLSKDEFLAYVFHDPQNISTLTNTHHKWRRTNWLDEYKTLEPVINELRDHLLNIEVQRGDLATPTSKYANKLERIYGAERLCQLLNNLGKTTLVRGYYYYGNQENSKKEVFSRLIKICYPLESDTQEHFNTLANKIKLSEARWIEIATYAPQWQEFISSYLGWEGLDRGIWWMRAHTKTHDYREMSAEDESEIAKYSHIDIADFKEGAVDIQWFEEAYTKLGKQRWKLLYDASKYVSEANGHRRAKLYSDVLTNDLKIRAVTAKIKDKRDKDYVRLYGLVPLSKTKADADILKRYQLLQKFKKESKQFGSQRQASEGLAVSVGMDNLARNAGYSDPQRLTWAMETAEVKSVFAKENKVILEKGLTTELIIDESGMAQIICERDGKKLKAIPAKYKKDKRTIELKSDQKMLREQFRRARKGLEDSMVRGDVFTKDEVILLFEHPVISKHLEKLVFIDDKKETLGYFFKGKLINAHGNKESLIKTSKLRIAHPVDLHQHKVWRAFQKDCFTKKLKQPFKQIFRELYLPTKDELKAKQHSKRYAGHQVQPKKTLALLKSRGWRVDYEEGLQKLFRTEGFTVKLYAVADWFSPGDVEAPTLETIAFHSLKDGKYVDFKKIEPRIFSEVMRDIDLVVSVAHVGEVDPEASHSTVEMRKVILEESLKLFKLKNVKVKDSHAIIKGKLGEYSIHLGSAIVQQMPSRYLSVLAIQSQHRGRIFLPFMDDDPRTAELIAKILMFSKDDKIQDPTILQQIDPE